MRDTSESWRAWAGDVAAVTRRNWRSVGTVLLVTVTLPLLPLAGLVAVGAAAGAAISPEGKGSVGILAAAILAAPFLLVVGAGCGLVVARGWTGAVWAAGSAGSGKPAGSAGPGEPAGLREALRGGGRPGRRLRACYLAGLALLVGAAFGSGYLAPAAPTVPDLLMLAGPAGLLAPVLSLAPAGQRAYPGPMAAVLAVVVGSELAAALALSRLLASGPLAGTGAGLTGLSGPVAVIVASLIALPGSLLLAAATSASRYGHSG